MWDTNTLLLRDKLVFVSCLPCESPGLGWGLGQDRVSVSTVCLDGALLSLCKAAVQLLFRSFPERIVPCIAVDVLCLWERVGSGPS